MKAIFILTLITIIPYAYSIPEKKSVCKKTESDINKKNTAISKASVAMKKARVAIRKASVAINKSKALGNRGYLSARKSLTAKSKASVAMGKALADKGKALAAWGTPATNMIKYKCFKNSTDYCIKSLKNYIKTRAVISKAYVDMSVDMSEAYKAYSKASADEDNVVKNIKKHCSKNTLKILKI